MINNYLAMPSRRGHEASPGGDNLTHREHYGREERRDNRRERGAERREARKEYRGKRTEIREEIDMARAGLARRLSVRLAEVEELREQHKKENLTYALPENYEAIKARIESLGDGEDKGKYESEFPEKRLRRRAMNNDLQILRLRVRGLRTSLRRHTSHEVEEVEAPPVIPVEPKPEPKERPQPRTGQRPPSAPRRRDEEVVIPDPPPAAEIKDPVPAMPTAAEIAEEKAAEETRIEEAKKRAEEIRKAEEAEKLAAEKAKEEAKIAEEAKKAEDLEKAELEKKEAAEREKLHDEAIDLLKGFKLDEIYDEEFIDWIDEKNPDEIIPLSDLLKSDDENTQKTANKKLEVLYDDYVGELLGDTDELFLGEYGVDKEFLDENSENIDLFWKFYRESDPSSFIEDLRNLYEGSGTVEGIAAFESISQLYNSDECIAYRNAEKLQESPIDWVKDVVKNKMNEREMGGMEVKESAESGIELHLEGSSLELIKEGDSWILNSPKYPNLLKEGVEARYDSPELALIDARKLLREIVLMDTLMESVQDMVGHEAHPHKPFMVTGSDSNIEFKDSRWYMPNANKAWDRRGGIYQANHLVDIFSITNALNTAYLNEHGYSEAIPQWEKDKRNAKRHFNKVDELQKERNLDLTLEANESFDGVTVTEEGLGESLSISRNENAWIVHFDHPEMLGDSQLTFDNPKTGLMEAVTLSKTLLRRAHELNNILEEVESIESPDALFSLDDQERIQFNGRTLFVNRTSPYSASKSFDHDLIQRKDFVNALNLNYLSGVEGVDADALEASDEMRAYGWKLNHTKDLDRSTAGVQHLEQWKVKFPIEISNEGTAYLDLNENHQVKIQKVEDQWMIDVPERYLSAIEGSQDLAFDSLEQLIQKYDQIMPMILKVHTALTVFEEKNLSLDAAELQKNGQPFYYKNDFTWGNQVMFSSETTGSTLSRSVYDGRSQKMDSQFNFRNFIKVLNEIYISENQAEYADALAAKPVAQDVEIDEDRLRSTQGRQWGEPI